MDDKFAIYSAEDFLAFDLATPTRELQKQLADLESLVKGKHYSILKAKQIGAALAKWYVLSTRALTSELRTSAFPTQARDWARYLRILSDAIADQYAAATVLPLSKKQPSQSTNLDPRDWLVATDEKTPIAIIRGSADIDYRPPRPGHGGVLRLTTGEGEEVLFRPRKTRGGAWLIGDAITEPPPAKPKESLRVPSSRPTEQAGNREVLVTGHTPQGAPVTAFKEGQKYRLRFGIGAPVAGNLAQGNTKIGDVPPGGLNTHWVVSSTDVEFIADPSTAPVHKVGSAWTAEFDLHIPETGEATPQEIAILAGAKPGSVHVTIYAVGARGREIYREVSVSLKGEPKVTADETVKAILHTNLRTTHEWTTPPEHVQLSINDGVVGVSTKRVRLVVHEFREPFSATANRLDGPIRNVRSALERFREIHEAYLNDLDKLDIAARVGQPGTWEPNDNGANGWQPLPDKADKAHRESFDKVVQSKEWRELAHAGFALFDCCFDANSQVRKLLEKLPPGSRVDFHWSNQSGPGQVAHVPWSLMYTEPVDVRGRQLAAPEKFLGLRFRIGARSWSVGNGSVVLGGLDAVHSVNLLYWGDKKDDDVAIEAGWQAEEYRKLKLSLLLPDRKKPDFKEQIKAALDAPEPRPVGVVYFYCHCSVGKGENPCLRFGNTSRTEDTLERADLSQTTLADAPLVFANACTTAQADPHMTSELEDSFFRRGIRAFIGTETKVPIKLASKFAWLYFLFLYRIVDKAPMAAGEALTQARLFLWTQYKNVGGLFYSMTNQYELYVASDDEVLKLRN